MKYKSTRGQEKNLSFKEVASSGLAKDGGLYIPEEIPEFSKSEISKFKNLTYQELVFKIIKPFIGDDFTDDKLKDIIDRSYAKFTHSDIAPLVEISNNNYILELFHGPTLAFKDFALQFLGNILDEILNQTNEKVTIVGATSGDTGSAAISGCVDCKNVNLFIMHPFQRVSDVQRKQMTTVKSDNVFNLAIKSDFDFCQDVVKKLFADDSFLQGKSKLVAINSINWCRIMAQIIYYFYAALKLGAPDKMISFSVPTGNFGDIFAGYIAKKMGLPINQLIIATNSNDILHRFMQNQKYERGKLVRTLSPSMDIQVSSNFERLLYYIHDENGNIINDLMEKFKTGPISIENDKFDKIKSLFSSQSCSDEQILSVIKNIYDKSGQIIDPHTATGIYAADKCNKDLQIDMVTLSTAHPAKFLDAVEKAGISLPKLPDSVEPIMNLEEKYQILEANIDKIKEYISNNLQ